MPIYEYECTNCGHQMEVWQKFSDPPRSRCELCQGKVKKLISQSTFHLKGSGWYVTDYGSKGSGGSPPEKKPEKDTTPKSEKASTNASKKESSKTDD